MVFNQTRDLLDITRQFLAFFCEESCGYCTPCRVGNQLLRERLAEIAEGRGEPGDLDYLEELATVVKLGSRCGLGQTSPNPVLSTLENFRAVYQARLRPATRGEQRRFDIQAALATAEAIAGRKSQLGVEAE